MNLALLGRDLVSGVVLADVAEFWKRGLLTVNAALGDHVLNWKAMGVPTKNEWGLIACHVLITDYKVL